MQGQALLGLLITLPLICVFLFQKEGRRGDIAVEVPARLYLRTGYVDSNSDSLRLAPADSLRLLARQGALIWAETPDGRHRGFVRRSDFGDDVSLPTLPRRSASSSYFISRARFDSLMANPATTLAMLERDYISAMCIHPVRGGARAEFDFFVVEPDARQSRPVVTFGADGTVADYALTPWRPAKGLSGFETVEFIAPLISNGEIDQYDPYTDKGTGWIWALLIGYVPLFLYMLILWLRWPLCWLPNSVANFIAYALCVLGPAFWCSILLIKGVPAMPWVPVTVLMIFVGVVIFWAFNSGLRCPRCKVLQNHEYVQTLKGKPFEEVDYTTREVRRQNLSRQKKSKFKHRTYTNREGVEVHETIEYFWYECTDRVFYEKYKITSVVRMLTDSFVCPRCGHGKNEARRQVLSSQTEVIGSFNKVETHTEEEKPW